MSRVFDATNTGANEQSLQAPSIPALVRLTATTVAAWIRTDGKFDEIVGTGGTITSKDVGGGRVTLSMNLSSPTFTSGEPPNLNCDMALSPGTTFAGFVSVETIPLNNWTHVVFTWDQLTGITHGFINAAEVSYSQHVSSSNPPAVDLGGNLWIGDDIVSGKFNGSIAEVAIWNTVLTPSQLQKLVLSTTGAVNIQSANLVAYYHLCGISSPEPDASGNANPAVLSSNPPVKGAVSPGYNCPYSVKDCRNYSKFPNASRDVNGATTYDVQTSSNSVEPSKDSRTAGKPVPCNTYPQNSRTPGTFGPGE
jgi:hypothetical protein